MSAEQLELTRQGCRCEHCQAAKERRERGELYSTGWEPKDVWVAYHTPAVAVDWAGRVWARVRSEQVSFGVKALLARMRA